MAPRPEQLRLLAGSWHGIAPEGKGEACVYKRKSTPARQERTINQSHGRPYKKAAQNHRGSAATIPFDYQQVNAEDRQFLESCATEIRKGARRTIDEVVAIGKSLSEAKERLGHGLFLKWIKTEFNWTPRTAQRCMNVYHLCKSDTVSHLQIDLGALYAIAAPQTPPAVRSEMLEQARNSSVSKKEVQDAISRYHEGAPPEETTPVIYHKAPPPEETATIILQPRTIPFQPEPAPPPTILPRRNKTPP